MPTRRPAGEHAPAARVGQVDLFLGGPGAVHAVLAEERVVDGVAAHQRGGVRLCGGGTGTGGADLHEDHRLALLVRHRQRGAQPPGIPHSFGVGEDHRDVVLQSEPVDALGNVGARLVAGGHPVADADVAAAAQVGKVAAIGTALTDHRDAAPRRDLLVEGAAEGADETAGRVQQPQAVGAEQPQVPAPRDAA